MASKSHTQTGTIIKIGETEKVSDKFSKREFVIKYKNGDYEKFAAFELAQDRCELLDRFTEGQEVEVHFDVESREYKERWYTNCRAWRIDATGAAQPLQPSQPQAAPQVANGQEPVIAGDDEGVTDLPF